MEISIPSELKPLIGKFKDCSFQLFLVGGAVRDLILETVVKDYDFTTDAKPEEILKLFPDGFYNNTFGTVGVNTPLGVVEITTMRKESGYGDSRHPQEVVWTNKIEEDLKRRDFTINAMALSSESWVVSCGSKEKLQLVDPFGGQGDLKQKLIRAVGDPSIRFQEDALRLMRAVRFATQLGFAIEEQTAMAIQKHSQKLRNISWERIRDELLKILSNDNPYEGMVMLRSSTLLQIILPEVEACFGIIQEGPKHDRVYDIGEHSFLSLKFCSSTDPFVRFACLIHDTGKVPTHKIDAEGNVTFYGHDVVGGKVAEVICQRLKFSKKQTELVVRLVKYHLFTVDEHQTDSALRRFIRNVGEDNLENMFILREADSLGGSSNPTSWRTESFKKRTKELLIKPFSITDLKVTGKDVMEVLNIPPSRKVGEILDKLFAEVEEDKTKNDRDYLLDRIKQIA